MVPRSRVRVVLAALAAWLAASVTPALAATSLAPPVEGASHVMLGFGVTYGEGTSSRVHHGVDIGAAAGAEVRAPAGGTVSFAGRLPAGDGGETLGITITTGEGLKVTCLPLADLKVSSGEQVEQGAAIAEVAADGDPSSVGAHVHLSVREGESYVDPEAMLALTPAPPPRAQPNPPPAEAPPAAGTRPAPAPRPTQVHAPAGAAPAPRALSAPAGADTRAEVPAPRVARAAQSAFTAAQPAQTAATTRAGRAETDAGRMSSPATVGGESLLASMRAALGGARKAVTALAELLVAAAFLWPAWRRVSAPSVSLEPAPARART